MKKAVWILGLVVFFTACDNVSISTDNKLDSLGNHIENKSEQVWDSTKQKAKDLKEKIENRLDNDSADRRNDTSGTKN